MDRLTVAVFGQRSFGAAAAQAIADRANIAVIVAPPVTGTNRPDPLWQTAGRLNIDRVPADTYRHEQLPPVDLIVAAHSHNYLGRKTRAKAKLGALGYHPSLLPLNRGRDAIRWVIHERRRVTGGTTFWLDDNVDAGPIALQQAVVIDPTWTASDLWSEALFPLGIELLENTIGMLDQGIIPSTPQNHRLATWEPSWERPPIHRPELPELGQLPDGYTYRIVR